MKTRRSSKFGQIGPLRAELSALERLTKSPYTYNRENGVATFFSCFDRIFFILTGKDDIHTSLIEFKIRPHLTRNYSVSCFERQNNRCFHFFSITIYPIHFIFVGIKDIHNI